WRTNPLQRRPQNAVTIWKIEPSNSSRPNTSTVASVVMNDEPMATTPRMIKAMPMPKRNTRDSRKLSRSLVPSLVLLMLYPVLMIITPSFLDCQGGPDFLSATRVPCAEPRRYLLFEGMVHYWQKYQVPVGKTDRQNAIYRHESAG